MRRGAPRLGVLGCTRPLVRGFGPTRFSSLGVNRSHMSSSCRFVLIHIALQKRTRMIRPQVVGQVGRVREGAQSPSSADVDAACQSHRTKGSARAEELAMKRAGYCQKRAGEARISRYHGPREPAHSVRNRA